MIKAKGESVLAFAVVLLVGFWLFAGLAEAGVNLTPKAILKDITPEDNSFSYTLAYIAGPEDDPITVKVSPTGLTVDPIGHPTPIESEEELKAAASLFRIEPDQFTLAPGASQEIGVQVILPEGLQGGIYKMFIFEITGLHIETTGPTPQRVRLTSPVMLVIPGPFERTGEIVGLQVHQEGPGEVILIEMDFKNTGNVHFSPGGTIMIADSEGREVTQVPIAPHTAFPGCVRRLEARWKPEGLADGNYSINVAIQIPGGYPVTAGRVISVVSLNTIGVQEAELLRFSVPQTEADEPIVFHYRLLNQGNVPFPLRGTLKLLDRDKRLVGEVPLPQETLKLGQEKRFTATWKDGLPPGLYTATLEVSPGEDRYGGAGIIIAEKRFIVAERDRECRGKILEFAITPVLPNAPLIGRLVVENTGESPLTVEGFVTLASEDEKPLGQIVVEQTTIPPGESRDMGALWHTLLLAGSYRADVVLLCDNGTTTEGSATFTIAAPEGESLQELRIVSFSIGTAVADEQLDFNYCISNQGVVPLSFQPVTRIFDAQSNIVKEITGKQAELSALAAEEFSATLESGLPAGNYTAILELKYGREDSPWTESVEERQSFSVSAKIGEIVEFLIEQVGGRLIPRLTFKNLSSDSMVVEGLINVIDAEGGAVWQIILGRTTVRAEKTMVLRSMKMLGKSGEYRLAPGKYIAEVDLLYQTGDGRVETLHLQTELSLSEAGTIALPGRSLNTWIILAMAIALLSIVAAVVAVIVKKRER